MNTFPDVSQGTNFGSHVQVYADSKCASLAAVFGMNGAPLPQSQVAVVGGQIQQFQCALSIVYLRNSSGIIEVRHPSSLGSGQFQSAASSEATTATAGGGASLPATVAGFLAFSDHNGVTRKIPYYAN